MSATPPWTFERESELKDLYWAGHSYSQIASMMGGITREAISGKVSRMGLNTSGLPRIPLMRSFAPRNGFKPLTEPIVAPADAPEPYHLDLEAVSDRTCRYPFGNGPFTFCGHLPAAGKLYCPYHWIATHTPPKPVLRRA